MADYATNFDPAWSSLTQALNMLNSQWGQYQPQAQQWQLNPNLSGIQSQVQALDSDPTRSLVERSPTPSFATPPTDEVLGDVFDQGLRNTRTPPPPTTEPLAFQPIKNIIQGTPPRTPTLTGTPGPTDYTAGGSDYGTPPTDITQPPPQLQFTGTPAPPITPTTPTAPTEPWGTAPIGGGAAPWIPPINPTVQTTDSQGNIVTVPPPPGTPGTSSASPIQPPLQQPGMPLTMPGQIQDLGELAQNLLNGGTGYPPPSDWQASGGDYGAAQSPLPGTTQYPQMPNLGGGAFPQMPGGISTSLPSPLGMSGGGASLPGQMVGSQMPMPSNLPGMMPGSAGTGSMTAPPAQLSGQKGGFTPRLPIQQPTLSQIPRSFGGSNMTVNPLNESPMVRPRTTGTGITTPLQARQAQGGGLPSGMQMPPGAMAAMGSMAQRGMAPPGMQRRGGPLASMMPVPQGPGAMGGMPGMGGAGMPGGGMGGMPGMPGGGMPGMGMMPGQGMPGMPGMGMPGMPGMMPGGMPGMPGQQTVGRRYAEGY